MPALVAATSLLSLFPEGLYNLAQAVLVPFLVDKDQIGSPGMAAIRRMMVMDPPPAFQVYPNPLTLNLNCCSLPRRNGQERSNMSIRSLFFAAAGGTGRGSGVPGIALQWLGRCGPA